MREPGLTKVTTQSLAEQAREMIRNAIFEGVIKPEERLTIERIAAEMGISRTPVREALKALEADGIVKLFPHRGAIVQRFDEAEIQDRYSVRATLEAYAGALAWKHRGSALANELEANCATMEALIDKATPASDLNDVKTLLLLNEKFHRLIFESSGSAVTIRLLESLKMPLAYRLYHWRVRERQRLSLAAHRDIVEAFRAPNPQQVRELLSGHILEARDFLLNQKVSQRAGDVIA